MNSHPSLLEGHSWGVNSQHFQPAWMQAEHAQQQRTRRADMREWTWVDHSQRLLQWVRGIEQFDAWMSIVLKSLSRFRV